MNEESDTIINNNNNNEERDQNDFVINNDSKTVDSELEDKEQPKTEIGLETIYENKEDDLNDKTQIEDDKVEPVIDERTESCEITNEIDVSEEIGDVNNNIENQDETLETDIENNHIEDSKNSEEVNVMNNYNVEIEDKNLENDIENNHLKNNEEVYDNSLEIIDINNNNVEIEDKNLENDIENSHLKNNEKVYDNNLEIQDKFLENEIENNTLKNNDKSEENLKNNDSDETPKQSSSELNVKNRSIIKASESLPHRPSPRDSEVTRKLSNLSGGKASKKAGRRGSMSTAPPPPNSPASTENDINPAEKVENNNIENKITTTKSSFRRKSSTQYRKSICSITRKSGLVLSPQTITINSNLQKNDKENISNFETIQNIRQYEETPRTALSKNNEIHRSERDLTWRADDEVDELKEDSEIEDDPSAHWVIPPPGSRLAERSVAPSFFIAKKEEIIEIRDRERLQVAKVKQARQALAKSRLARQRHMEQVAVQRRKQMAAWRRKRNIEQMNLNKRFRQIENRKQQQIRYISRRKFDEMQKRIAREREQKQVKRQQRIEEEALLQWLHNK